MRNRLAFGCEGVQFMKKKEYIEMLMQDIETEDEVKKELFKEVVDCAEIALSQTSDNADINAEIGIKELWKIIEDEGVKVTSQIKIKDIQKVIEDEGVKVKAHCVGPFRAAELIAEKLGVNYLRASKRLARKQVKSLEDFL